MEPNTCPICNATRKWVPPGVSKKTGNSYNGFWSCPNNCKPPRNNPPQGGSGTPPQINREPVDQGNDQRAMWEAKDLRIARESVLSTISKIMPPQTDLVAAAALMIEASEILIRYVYRGVGSSAPTEDVTEEEMDNLPF